MKVLIGTVLVALALGHPAQAKPDFSGRWTSEPEPAAAPPAGAPGQPARGGGAGPAGPGRGGPAPDVGSGWGSTITIAQAATSLTVEYAFFGRGDMQLPLKFTYALDGSETRNSVMMGRGNQVQTSRATWNGDALVITTTYGFTDPQTGKPASAEVKRTLKLESPTTLSVETVYAGVLGGPSTTAKTTYRKL